MKFCSTSSILRVSSLVALFFVICLTGVHGQTPSSVVVTPLPNNEYRITTTNLGTDDLVFYRFSDGFDMTATNGSASVNAPVNRKFKNGQAKVSALIARKNGPVSIATADVQNTNCSNCPLPLVGLTLGEYVRLRSTSWDAFIDPATPEPLLDDKAIPNYYTPSTPWFLLPITIKAPQANSYVTVSIPSNMTIKGALVKSIWQSVGIGQTFYTVSDPDVSSFLYPTASQFRIYLTSSFNSEFNIYLLVSSATLLGEQSTFCAQMYAPNGMPFGSCSTETILTRPKPHDPNDLVNFQDYTCRRQETNPPLRYHVDFQNTGAGTAESVDVKVAIDNQVLDASTLFAITSNAQVTSYEITNSYVLFHFNGINLLGTNQDPQPPLDATKAWVEFSQNTRYCLNPAYGKFNTLGFITFTGNNGTFHETMGTNKVTQWFADAQCPVFSPACGGNKLSETGTLTEPTTIVKCYPSIFRDVLHVDIPATEETSAASIMVSDLTGKMWHQKYYHNVTDAEINESLSTSTLPAGMYIVHVKLGDANSVFKVIKE
jgi:hypothetical protein